MLYWNPANFIVLIALKLQHVKYLNNSLQLKPKKESPLRVGRLKSNNAHLEGH